MPITVTINIDKNAEVKRFLQATYKTGRSADLKQQIAYNIQADTEESADKGLIDAMYDAWWERCIVEMSEFVTEHDEDSVTLSLPSNWGGSRASLKYYMCELIHNGMLGDWYDDVKPDIATAFKKKAVLNQVEISSTVYSCNAPSM